MEGFTCSNLTKRMEAFIVRDIDFHIEPGMVMGLVGVNGAGKTTIIHTLLGAGTHRLTNEDDSGEFFIDGYHFIRDVKEYRNRIAYILSEPPFIGSMCPIQLGELYGYYYDTFDLDKYRKLLETYDIPERTGLEKLSTGQQLKLQLAFSLSYDAALYVMDEPTGNLDVDFRDEFYRIIRELAAAGKMIILSSHLITELEMIADTLLWIVREGDESGMFYQGTVDDLKEEYRLVEGERKIIEWIPDRCVVGKKLSESHCEALVRVKGDEGEQSAAEWLDAIGRDDGANIRYADLTEIMYYVEKNRRCEKTGD